jgi:hypothetical protein
MVSVDVKDNASFYIKLAPFWFEWANGKMFTKSDSWNDVFMNVERTPNISRHKCPRTDHACTSFGMTIRAPKSVRCCRRSR